MNRFRRSNQKGAPLEIRVHPDTRDHEHDGQDAEREAGKDGPPPRVEPPLWVKPSEGIGVEDQPEDHDAGSFQHVVVIHAPQYAAEAVPWQ